MEGAGGIYLLCFFFSYFLIFRIGWAKVSKNMVSRHMRDVNSFALLVELLSTIEHLKAWVDSDFLVEVLACDLRSVLVQRQL